MNITIRNFGCVDWLYPNVCVDEMRLVCGKKKPKLTDEQVLQIARGEEVTLRNQKDSCLDRWCCRTKCNAQATLSFSQKKVDQGKWKRHYVV